MPLKRFVLQPGMIRDGTRYAASGGWWDMQWMRFHIGSPQSMGGWEKFPLQNNAQYAGVARSLFSWTALDGTPLLACGTTTNYYIAAEGVLHDVTPPGLPVSNSSELYGNGYGVVPWGTGAYSSSALNSGTTINFQMRLWSQWNWGQDLFVCDKDMPDGLYYWHYDRGFGGTLVKLSSMAAGCPYIARQVFVTDDRHAVCLGATHSGATLQDRMNVWWSDIEDITDWTPTDTNEAGSFRLAIGSEIIAGRPARLENLIWTDRALYSMKYVGAPYIFGFSLVAQNVSIAGMNCTVDNGSVVFWMGQGEFYAYSGAVEILPCPIRDYVFNGMNMAYATKFFAGLNRSFGELWFFYVSQNAIEIDSYACYNWVDNLWYFGSLQRTTWLDPGIGRYPFATQNGMIYQHEFGADADGSPLYSMIESADLDLDDGHRFVFCKRVMPDVHFMANIANPSPAPQVTVTVTFKAAPEMTPGKSVSAVYAQAGGMIYIRGRGRAAAFRIESMNKGVTWRVGNMRADVQPDGRH